jgi:ketosteroid isomerase-like protein
VKTNHHKEKQEMKKALVCVAALLSVFAVQAQMGGNAGGVEKQIIGLEQKWAEAQKASNVDAIGPMLANNFVIVFADGNVMSKSQALDDTKKSKMESVDISDLKVTSYGDTAVITGIWKGKGTDGSGKPINQRERFIDSWHKSADGKWQCIGSGNTNLQ